jgi:hypothetical protein
MALPQRAAERTHGACGMSGIGDTVDCFFGARAAIFAHVGYAENWCVLPINDSRDQFWAVDKYEREWVKFSPERAPLVYWLGNHADEYGSYGNVLYQNAIYTQRHLPKWVYRGAELTLVVADTQTDGNKYLQLFCNANEVHTGDHPSNLSFNHLIPDDVTVSSRDAQLALVRDLCVKTSDSNLRIAIAVHRANCHQPSCLILAAMEEEDQVRSRKEAVL